jgi:hypothetical protein
VPTGAEAVMMRGMLAVVVMFVIGGLCIAGTIVLVRRGGAPAPSGPAPEPQLRDRAIVTLTGTVRIAGEPLISPLSARRCVLYEAYANLYETTGETRTLIAQLAKRAMVTFELDTPLGIVIVDGSEADLELVPTPVFPRRPEREAAFLREHDRAEALVETATFEEISVDPDSLVSVRGMAVVDPASTTIRLVAHGEQQPLTIGTPRRIALIEH